MRFVGIIGPLLLAAAAPADQVIVRGTNWPGAKVVTLEQGRLQFRTAEGFLQEPWLDDVDFLNVDRGQTFADFNEAERYLSKGDAANAAIRYRRALRGSEDFWKDLIEVRLLQACASTGQWDQVAQGLTRVARGRRSGPALAARLIPTGLPEQRDSKTVEALDALDTAIPKETSVEPRVVLEFFRYELLRRTGDRRAADHVRSVAVRTVPSAIRCDRLFAIQLPALRGLFSDGSDLQKLQALDAFIQAAPAAMLPPALILKGEALLATAQSREELIRASWPFLRVVIHMPGDPAAPEALWGAARVLERMGLTDRAVEMLRECIAHPAIGVEIRKEAEVSLTRFRTKGE